MISKQKSKAFSRVSLISRSSVFALLQVVVLLANLHALALWYMSLSSHHASVMSAGTVHEYSRAGHKELIDRSKDIENVQRAIRPPEIWARSADWKVNHETMEMVQAVRELMSNSELENLQALCGRTMYHGLKNVVVSHNVGTWTFFSTGDLPLMWIRDSAFQIGILLPRLKERPALRPVVDGGLRAQAFYILQDPYANGYYPEWRDPFKENDFDRPLGRGGWVGTRNFELDSGAFYLNLLYNYWATPGMFRADYILSDPLIFEAANLLVDVWTREQNHTAENSPYRYYEEEEEELYNNGIGTPVGYTGMIWSGFRPSDDPTTYGYSIPSNMYAAAALQRALEINQAIWHSEEFDRKALKLLRDVESGIQKYGVVHLEDGQSIYAYEVDGLGNQLYDFDDPNWPSLISMPLLGWQSYDAHIYEATKSILRSKKYNEYWLEGKEFQGMGSPHTDEDMAWAIGIISEALTATTIAEKAEKVRILLKLQCNDGLMHESIDVNNVTACTRKWFEWANALLVTVAEHLVGCDCDSAAAEWHLEEVATNEKNFDMPSSRPQQHQGIEASIQWDVRYEERVTTWEGIGNLIE